MKAVWAGLTVAGLAGCCPYTKQPPVTASASVLPASQTRLVSVEGVAAACRDNVLRIEATGTAPSGGWSGVSLRRIALAGGVAAYEAVGVAPDGPATMALVPHALMLDDPSAAGVTSVRVLAASNEASAQVEPSCR